MMFLLLGLYNRHILFNSCIDCANSYFCCNIHNTKTATNELNAEVETKPVIAKLKQVSFEYSLDTYMYFEVLHSLSHCKK